MPQRKKPLEKISFEEIHPGPVQGGAYSGLGAGLVVVTTEAGRVGHRSLMGTNPRPQ